MIKAIRRPCVLAAAMVQRASKALAASRHSVPRAMAIPSACARRRASRVAASATGLGRLGLGGGTLARSLWVHDVPARRRFLRRGPGGRSTTPPWIRPATSGLMGGGWVGGLSSSPGRRWTKVAPFHCSSPHVCNGPFRRSSKPCGGSGGEGMTKAKLVGWLGGCFSRSSRQTSKKLKALSKLIASSNILPTIGMQRAEHALVGTGWEVHDGVFFDGLVHAVSLRRDWALSGGSFASRNNPERIQNFLGQLGRAVAALSCPGGVGHFVSCCWLVRRSERMGPICSRFGWSSIWSLAMMAALASAAASALNR